MVRNFDAVIFDMDGTLIESDLDFDFIRRDLGIAPGRGILETIESMAPEDRRRAHGSLLAHELRSAHRAVLRDGAPEVLQALREANVPSALLTRNAGEVMRLILDRFDCLRFELAWSREDGPIKPEPDGVLRACSQLGVQPARTLCVGDFQYDIQAANAAGAVSVLLVPPPQPIPECAATADHTIRSLREVLALVGL